LIALEQMRSMMESMNMNMDLLNQGQETMMMMTAQMSNMLRQVLDDKSAVRFTALVWSGLRD
jgi:hypothetical protein